MKGPYSEALARVVLQKSISEKRPKIHGSFISKTIEPQSAVLRKLESIIVVSLGNWQNILKQLFCRTPVNSCLNILLPEAYSGP